MVNAFIGILIWALAVGLFYLYIYKMLQEGEVLYMIKNLRAIEWVQIVIVFVVSVGISTILLQRNEYIYYWDSCMHWTPAVSLSTWLFTDPLAALQNVLYTIENTDYNSSMPLLYALLVRVFGREYSTTIVIVQIFFMCPAYIVISLYINKMLKLLGFGKQSVPLYVAFAAAIPCIENVLVIGFLDAPVLLISTAILIVVSDYDFSKYDVKKCLLIAVGILMLMVFRRHWSYWVVGLVFYMFTAVLFELKENTKLVMKNSLFTAATIGIFCIICLIGPLRGYLEHSLRNYESIYAAWNGPLTQKRDSLIGTFGFLIELAIISIPVCIVKSRRSLKFIIPLLCLICIPTYLMNRSVIMHDSHFYLIVVPIILVVVFGFNSVICLIKNKKCQIITCIVMVAFIATNYLCYGFYDAFSGVDNKVFSFLYRRGGDYNIHYRTLYRGDIDTIKEMVKDINTLTEEYDTNVYICAGTHDLNQGLLQYAYQPDTFNAIPRWYPSSDVDLRDGFNTSLFDAGVVVVEEPTPDLEIENYQKHIYGVIWFLSEQIRNADSPIGRHYQLFEQYNLQNERIGDIYIKVSDWEMADYRYLMDFYDELYPDNKDIFSERIQEYVDQLYGEVSKDQ